MVVDDNSPDGTSDYVRRMMKKYKNIILHVRERRLGIVLPVIMDIKYRQVQK